MNVLTGREWTILILIVVFSSVPAFGGLVRLVELAGGPSVLPGNPRALADPWPIILHVLASFVFCMAGALQFLPSLRCHRPTMHRAIGRLTVVAGFLSAISGLWMTVVFAFPEAIQGSLLYTMRIILSLAMIGLLGWAIIAVKAGSFRRHAASMLRAYAIGQGASTQAFLGIAWILTFGFEPTGFLRDCFMVFCWVLNLLAAEALIHLFIAKPRPSGLSSAERKTIHDMENCNRSTPASCDWVRPGTSAYQGRGWK
jgi:uncharacterized membrane protein